MAGDSAAGLLAEHEVDVEGGLAFPVQADIAVHRGDLDLLVHGDLQALLGSPIEISHHRTVEGSVRGDLHGRKTLFSRTGIEAGHDLVPGREHGHERPLATALMDKLLLICRSPRSGLQPPGPIPEATPDSHARRSGPALHGLCPERSHAASVEPKPCYPRP